MNRELNKDEIKFLKIVSKNKLKVDAINAQFKANIKLNLFQKNADKLKNVNFDNLDYDYLFNNGLITYQSTGKLFFNVNISPAGKSIVDKEKNSKLKFWLPTAISIVALVASIAAVLVAAFVK